MDAIAFFGDILAEKIGKPNVATRGLIRFSLKDEFGTADDPDYKKLLQAFKNSLKRRLENIGIENASKVSLEMVQELNKNQSILTMTTI